MTIIVGIESTVQPYVSVLASDRRSFPNMAIVNNFLNSLSLLDPEENPKTIQGLIPFVLNQGLMYDTYTKIKLNEDRNIALASTGITNSAFEEVEKFLLQGNNYFTSGSDIVLRMKLYGILSPAFNLSNGCVTTSIQELAQQDPLGNRTVETRWKEYLSHFSLEQRLLKKYIPEIPLIEFVSNMSRLHVLYGSHTDSQSARNFNFGLNAVFLLSTNVDTREGKRPLVFPLTMMEYAPEHNQFQFLEVVERWH